MSAFRSVVPGLCLLAVAPAALGGGGPSYRILAADKGHVALVNAQGEVEWEVPAAAEVHDLALLPDGNVLFPTGPTTVAEMTPEKTVVGQHTARPKAGYTGRVEVHAFPRLADGRTPIAESGNARLLSAAAAALRASEPEQTRIAAADCWCAWFGAARAGVSSLSRRSLGSGPDRWWPTPSRST
jgi:hypothetical protein